jgi:hypothetical protein
MQRILNDPMIATLAAVGSGGGTAALTIAQLIPVVASIIGATCAIVSTIAALVYHRRNYKINKQRSEKP